MRQQPEPAVAAALRAHAAKTGEEADRLATVLEYNAAAPTTRTWSGALLLVPYRRSSWTPSRRPGGRGAGSHPLILRRS
ncbi:hypothetical protein E6W17_34815 [Streptomyces sp. A1547]|nr:hypothetical protein E6W17_34815 [Streptomyces sp. A1547]